jgi:hypothetical protein
MQDVSRLWSINWIEVDPDALKLWALVLKLYILYTRVAACFSTVLSYSLILQRCTPEE